MEALPRLSSAPLHLSQLFCSLNAVPLLFPIWKVNVNQALMQHQHDFALSSLPSLITPDTFPSLSRSHLTQHQGLAPERCYFRKHCCLGLSFPTCITLELHTLNFSCWFIARPLSLAGPFCNSSQPAHVPSPLHSLGSSGLFTSRLRPFPNNVCVY